MVSGVLRFMVRFGGPKSVHMLDLCRKFCAASNLTSDKDNRRYDKVPEEHKGPADDTHLLVVVSFTSQHTLV